MSTVPSATQFCPVFPSLSAAKILTIKAHTPDNFDDKQIWAQSVCLTGEFSCAHVCALIGKLVPAESEGKQGQNVLQIIEIVLYHRLTLSQAIVFFKAQVSILITYCAANY